MDIVGKLGDPTADITALTPLVDHILDRLKAELVPAIGKAIGDALNGLTLVKK